MSSSVEVSQVIDCVHYDSKSSYVDTLLADRRSNEIDLIFLNNFYK